MLVPVKVAAKEMSITPSMVSYMAKKGYINKHYIYGNNRNYAVDLDQLFEELEKGYDRKRQGYNTHWVSQPRDSKGNFLSTKK